MESPRPTPNRVVLTLVCIVLAVLLLADFASVQANRIVPGQGLGLFKALGSVWTTSLIACLLAIAALAWRPNPLRYRVMLALVVLLLCQLPLSLAWFIHLHIADDQPYARAGIAAGGWTLLFIGSLLLIECRQRMQPAPFWWRAAPLGLVLISAWLIYSGDLAALSLLREYSSRRSEFWQALAGHLSLVGGALLGSLIIGLLLAWLTLRVPRLQRPIFGLLNFFQTIPSLALFGLLIAPLSYLANKYPVLQELGIHGIGWAPAIIALVAYSLLPVVRNTSVALSGVAPAVIESAHGMGMSSWQVLRQVRVPLALPVIIEGIRITTIQAIGLVAVAALIGASGFGSFIFQGLGQGAMDLVLLGALPTIFLALLADALFSALARHCQPGVRA
ncbi:MAG: ABC transporter permease [Pseudomonadaceae bacterium]|nr:ABC transporter permease [Pseudomonadaceae bacterium]